MNLQLDKQPSIEEVFKMLECHEKSFRSCVSKNVNILSYTKKLFINAKIFGAYQDNKFCGFLALHCTDSYSKLAYISLIFIIPEYYGIKVGTKLLEKAILHAKEVGMENIKLEVKNDNIPAINLYKNFGFKLVTDSNIFYIKITNFIISIRFISWRN